LRLIKTFRLSWWATTSSCVVLLVAGQVSADGLIMRFDESGNFGFAEAAPAFAKHFRSGGVRILPPGEEAESSVEVALPQPEAGRSAPRPRAEVLQMIHDTALRYAGHNALRVVGMSASEWVLLFQANIEIESAYNPRALSHAGAIGLGQLMPDTARLLGVDPHDMAQNLDGSARYLLKRLEQFGSRELALAAYNAGAQAVIRHDGIPPFRETQGHVRKVMAVFQRLQGDTL